MSEELKNTGAENSAIDPTNHNSIKETVTIDSSVIKIPTMATDHTESATVSEDTILEDKSTEEVSSTTPTDDSTAATAPIDYAALTLEKLITVLAHYIETESVPVLKNKVPAIKTIFDAKLNALVAEKKAHFIAEGGNEIDFKYDAKLKKEFDMTYKVYASKRNEYQKNKEQQLLHNLKERLAIIEKIKALVAVEEDSNSTYKVFKEIQDKWKTAGAVPKGEDSDLWKTYHHHVENFYDYLNLNRELRDLDFKHNLEEKRKIIERATLLAADPDLDRAFRELQVLHKIWKEDLGPVEKEHREIVWQEFSKATKIIHKRRQDFFKEQDKIQITNLALKNAVIEKITALSNNALNSHNAIQKEVKELELLREVFFKIGKVPKKDNDAIWKSFNKAARTFNESKNQFYKEAKREQQENLEKKTCIDSHSRRT